MPFISQDWRSPGEQWVKTSEGWETMKLRRVKIFENLNENVVARVNRLTIEKEDVHDKTPRSRPFIIFNSGRSKERLETTSLSEALIRLDIAGAARDLTRANYVFELLFHILKKNLPTLSGTSQKLIFNIIESMSNEALKSELNIGCVKELIQGAKKALIEGRPFHIGSPSLWSKHLDVIEKMSSKLEEYSLKERGFDGKLLLSELPTDCLRVIFAQIPDHKDLMRAAQTGLFLNEVTQESLLWKKLCVFHFNNSQIRTFIHEPFDESSVNWKEVYRRCYKRFGKKEIFADMLSICSNCSSIFWKSVGHPCISDKPAKCKDLSPKDFMSLFKL